MISRKFACVYFDDLTNQRLLKYCHENGIDMSKNDKHGKFFFHVTLMYSENSIEFPEIDFKVKPFTVHIEKFELFGEKQDCLVMKLMRTKELVELRDVIERTGLRDKWPEYKPHMTLSYACSDPKMLTKLRYPTFPLTVTGVKINAVQK